MALAPERKEQARAYRRIKYRLDLIGLGVTLLYLMLLVAGGSRWLHDVTGSTVLFIGALFLGLALFGLPGDYAHYRHERRYGLSVQSAGSWFADQLKGFVVGLILQGGLALLVLTLWSSAPGTWYLWAAAVAVAGVLLLTFVAPVVLMPLFVKSTPLPDGELKARLMALSQKTGVPVKGVYVSNTSAKATTLNASVSGYGATRRITLQDTTINACTTDEIEAVMGHELGHYVYGHVFTLTLLMAGVTALVFLVAGLVLEPLSVLVGLGGLTPAALPLLAVIFVGLLAVVMPVLMAISRKFERDCDAYTFRLTGKPAAFISFFRKAAAIGLSDLEPPRWVYYFKYSHPPIPERIAAAERFARGE